MREIINAKADDQKTSTKPASEQVSNSEDDVPLVNILGLPGKNVNYGLPGPKET